MQIAVRGNYPFRLLTSFLVSGLFGGGIFVFVFFFGCLVSKAVSSCGHGHVSVRSDTAERRFFRSNVAIFVSPLNGTNMHPPEVLEKGC